MALSKEVLDQWSNPPSIYRGAPFWSWNSKLDPDRLCRAIESMQSAGMGGFFMHSRYGLKTPYLSEQWFKCISACVEKARELGMKACLYDEDRWPSGSAGGLVTRDTPEYRNHVLVAAPVAELDEDAQRLATFNVQLDDNKKLVGYAKADHTDTNESLFAFDLTTRPTTPWYNDGVYLDTLMPEAVAEFIRVTHKAYADRYGKDFGSLIPAMFMDEPHSGYRYRAPAGETSPAYNLHWTPAFVREFKARRGYDILEYLPELVWASTDNAFSSVRRDYYMTVTELFVENFTKQVGQWCGEHNIALTGHMLSENDLDGQISVAGAAMPHYEHMQWPGVDILRDQVRELRTVKQCTSVAAQLGKERVLSELYGCTGWDWPLEGHKFIGDWQYAMGVNFRCQHLTHYSLAGGAKRDYPASIFSHSPWWPYYHVVEDYFARLSFMLTQGTPLRDVLVIHPVETGWGLYRPGQDNQDALAPFNTSLNDLVYTLTNDHYDWDFGDESLLAKYGQASDDGLVVGQMRYKVIIVPPTITLRQTTVKLLEQFIASGGKVLFIGQQPTCIDGREDTDITDLIASGIACDENAVISALESLLPRQVSITENGVEQHNVWAMLREIPDGRMLFIQSQERQKSRHLHIRIVGNAPVVRWDPITGEKYKIACATENGHTVFDIELPPTGSALLTLGVSVPDVRQPEKKQVVKTTEIDGPFDIECVEPNTLPLEYCQYRIADNEWSKPVPVLQADLDIREHYGLKERNGNLQQPWYLYATGVIDISPRDPVQLKWGFHVTQLPDKCLLALENPEDYTITVNGKPAGEVVGWWVDEDIKTLDIMNLLVEGDNEILLDFVYRPNMELEDAYLVGNFGVANRAKGAYQAGTATLVAPPTRLALGSWVEQGLPFYGGAVKYRLTVEKPTGKKRLRISLPDIRCTAAVIHVGEKQFVLPWAPFTADITDALINGENEIFVEIIGGRANILGPRHLLPAPTTSPRSFVPYHPEWIDDYILREHGLMQPIKLEELQ